jgi:hypothetical protein
MKCPNHPVAKSICNLGYACDGCPYNPDLYQKLVIALDYGTSAIYAKSYKKVPQCPSVVPGRSQDNIEWISMDLRDGLLQLIALGKWAKKKQEELNNADRRLLRRMS